MTGPFEPEPEPAPPDPVPSRRMRIAQAVLSIVVVLAAGMELVRIAEVSWGWTLLATGALMTGNPVGGLVALVASVAGSFFVYRRPVLGLALVAAAPLLATALDWDPLVTWSIAVFSALALTLRGLSGTLTGVIVGIANFAAVGLSHGTVAFTDPSASVAGFAALAAAAGGSAIRDHHRYLSELHQRTHDALSTRQAAVDRGIAEERVRIARDLHDSLGHRIAVLSMRLGAAEVHLPSHAEASRTDIVAARNDLQAVLLETQQILRVLRVDHDTDREAPAPAIDRIPELITGFREAGLTVEATLGDLTRPVAPQVSAAAFRVTQEVLTNAHRHSTGAVSLLVDTDGTTIVIESVNVRAPGRHDHEPQGGGFGLIGLRERVASAGGRIEAQPDGELFTVRAVLPAAGRTTS